MQPALLKSRVAAGQAGRRLGGGHVPGNGGRVPGAGDEEAWGGRGRGGRPGRDGCHKIRVPAQGGGRGQGAAVAAVSRHPHFHALVPGGGGEAGRAVGGEGADLGRERERERGDGEREGGGGEVECARRAGRDSESTRAPAPVSLSLSPFRLSLRRTSDVWPRSSARRARARAGGVASMVGDEVENEWGVFFRRCRHRCAFFFFWLSPLVSLQRGRPSRLTLVPCAAQEHAHACARRTPTPQ